MHAFLTNKWADMGLGVKNAHSSLQGPVLNLLHIHRHRQDEVFGFFSQLLRISRMISSSSLDRMVVVVVTLLVLLAFVEICNSHQKSKIQKESKPEGQMGLVSWDLIRELETQQTGEEVQHRQHQTQTKGRNKRDHSIRVRKRQCRGGRGLRWRLCENLRKQGRPVQSSSHPQYTNATTHGCRPCDCRC